jgi:dephospho-CoA kinase
MKNKPVVGILGGIGSGKSTVANQFANLGCAVIQADKIAHEVLEEQGIIDTISAVFGRDILSSDGMIDRSKLAARVFENLEELEKLQAVVHPPIIDKCDQLLTQYLANSSISAVILDVPLLVESGYDKRCDVLVFVDCPDNQRFQRAAKKGLSEDQIKKREIFQISLDKKRQMAHYVIKNNSEMLDLTEQVAQIYSAMIAM